jgi:hypothetical protein
MPDREAAKALILKILAISGGELEAESRLNKAFYAAHLLYWKKHKGVLSDYPVVKLPNGPGVDRLREILAELQAEGRIEIVKGVKGPYPQTTVRLRAVVQVDPSAPEFDSIRKAVSWVRHRSTRKLAELTHDRPSYDGTRIGYEQAIYLDLLSEEEFETVSESCAAADAAFRAALSGDT